MASRNQIKGARMKLKFIGDQDEITLRGVTFEKGKAQVIEDEALSAKLAAMPEFEEVKRGRKPHGKDET